MLIVGLGLLKAKHRGHNQLKWRESDQVEFIWLLMLKLVASLERESKKERKKEKKSGYRKGLSLFVMHFYDLKGVSKARKFFVCDSCIRYQKTYLCIVKCHIYHSYICVFIFHHCISYCTSQQNSPSNLMTSLIIPNHSLYKGMTH